MNGWKDVITILEGQQRSRFFENVCDPSHSTKAIIFKSHNLGIMGFYDKLEKKLKLKNNPTEGDEEHVETLERRHRPFHTALSRCYLVV